MKHLDFFSDLKSLCMVCWQVEDARVAMKLYQLHRRDWEASVKERLTRREIRERRAERKRREESTKRGLQQKSMSQTRRRPVVEKPFNIMLHTDR